MVDTKRLRELASAATPALGSDRPLSDAQMDIVHEYRRAANPQSVLFLLDRIDALEAEKASRRQQNALVAVAVERHHADCGATMCSPLCEAMHDPEAAHTARELCIAAAHDEEVERAMREGFETAVDSAEICHEATCEHEGFGSHINWTEARRDLEERISTLRGVGK